MKAWIFQGKPSRYDVAKKIEPGKREDWTANRSHEAMMPGDIVFFWRAGEKEPEKRGIYGWGTIIAPARLDKGSGWWIPINYIWCVNLNSVSVPYSFSFYCFLILNNILL